MMDRSLYVLKTAAILTSFGISSLALASTGFGSRKTTTSSASPTAASNAAAQNVPTSWEPPPLPEDSEWLRVPFEKAENEVLDLLKRDLSKLEDAAQEVSVYEIKTSGRLPQDYRRDLRAKIERTLLHSKRLKIKQCTACEQARVYRDEKGEVKYESSSTDLSRPAKLASEIGVDHFLYAEMSYTPEDLQLRVRLVEPTSGQIRWTKDYSTADVVKTREGMNDADSDELGHRDSLARVLLGEIAFTTVLSPGVGILPTIDNGSGASMTAYPSFDLFIGEKFDRGRKVFGFLLGGTFTIGNTGGMEENNGSKPLPWALRMAPRFRYVFNPYSMTTARFSIAGEVGGLISTGLATAYVGLGPEIAMINRFSVSLTPLYIFPGTVTGTQVFTQSPDGGFSEAGAKASGKFGGAGILFKASINW